jgi:hypothetical protein
LIKKFHTNFYIFLILYFTLILGFIFDESLNPGAYKDWAGAYSIPIVEFSKNFHDSFLNYEKYGNRHSPFYIMALSLLFKAGFNLDFIRLINLHICIFLVIVFYNCLRIRFEAIDKSTLQLLSLVIFLSPTFRSLAIWPDSRIVGLLFFVITIYYYLKFIKTNLNRHAFYSAIALIFSSYLSPNFSLFSIFFYYTFYKSLKSQYFVYLILLSTTLSIPMIYYLFILDVNFIVAGKTPGLENNIDLNFNISDKFLIISTIFFFHLFPIIFFLINKTNLIKFLKNKIILICFFLVPSIYFFNYDLSYTGGGVFYQISEIIFQGKYFFYVICFFSVAITIYVANLNKTNLILVTISILSNIQNTIYHKYYEPFFLILVILLFKNLNFKNFFQSKKSLIYLYGYSFLYILLRLIKNYYFL